jgi:Replication-relaxation
VNQREYQILLSLKKCDYLSRSQIQRIHNLGKDRNAQRILQGMARYLSSFRDKENVYYLSKEGREMVDATKVRKKTPQVQHYLMRNEIFLAFQQPFTWKNEIRFKLNGKPLLVSDAVFNYGDINFHVEVDCTQSMAKNRKKVEKYKRLNEVRPLELIWITTNEYRRKALQKLCEGLKVSVYTTEDFR